MNNPFEAIEERLIHIETLLLNLNKPTKEQPTQTPKEELLNVEATAKFLNLSTATIYSKVSRGELPVMKRGKRLYFSNTELMDYLREGRKRTLVETAQNADLYLKNRK